MFSTIRGTAVARPAPSFEKWRRSATPLALRSGGRCRTALIGSEARIEIRIKNKKGKNGACVVCSSAVGEQSRWFGDVDDGVYHHRQEQQQLPSLHVQDELKKKKVEIVIAATVTVVLGTCNRVLYKLALIPLRHYPFFLAQLATFAYVVVYFSILYCRYRAGIVTNEMLSLPKTPFIIIGLLEAAAAAAGMAAGAVLSGALIPILSQTFLVWQLILSALFLGRRYRANQLLGCLLVSLGVMLTVMSGSGAGLSVKNAGLFWILLMTASFLLQAADSVLKETIFLDAKGRCKGGSVDLFVVNSFGSAFQAFFICLLVPFLSKLWGIPFHMLPAYVKDGAACFLNIGRLANGCGGAPMLPVLFIIVNMAFNISLLHLIKISSAVVSCLASTFSVPLSIYAFTLPLPYLASPTPLSSGFIAGTAVLVAGLLLYSWTPATNLPATFVEPRS